MVMFATADARMASDRQLTADQVVERLRDLPGWNMNGKAIRRTWSFRDHYETMAFVNAVAWVSHRTDHHPDMQVGYNKVTVDYSTHSTGGVSEKDLICAARLSELG